jgi:hypothetical protein
MHVEPSDCSLKKEMLESVSICGMTRRDFCYAMGSLATSCIMGCFLSSKVSDAIASAGEPSDRPCFLRRDVQWSKEGDMTVIRHGQGKSEVICMVNDTGAHLLEKMDGKKTIEQLGQTLAAQQAPNADAQVAYFTAQLASMGFLTRPFYATLYDRTVIK